MNKGCTHTYKKTAIWFLTSRRRLLSLTVLPSGRLSFLGSGLEDAELLTCFLEVFSGFARKNTKTKRIGEKSCDQRCRKTITKEGNHSLMLSHTQRIKRQVNTGNVESDINSDSPQ